jgi:hypothetical protein
MPIDLEPHKNPRIDSLTDIKRLGWVLDFIRRDLDREATEALEAMGDDLRHAAAPSWFHTAEGAGMPAAQVCALQQEIRQGIQAVMSDELDVTEHMMITMGHKDPLGGWRLPVEATRVVRVRLDHAGLHQRVWRMGRGTDERTAIIEGVARLLIMFGDRLSTCSVCGHVFVRQYRQEYCNVRCSNKVRNKRRLDRKAGRGSPTQV